MKRQIKKILQFFRLMFSDRNFVSSKRFFAALIIIDLLALIDMAVFFNKDISENAESIIISFLILALTLWGYNVIEKIFKK